MSEKLLTIGQAAEVLGISRSLAYALVAKGAIASVRVGPRSTRIRPEDLEAFIVSRRQGGEAR